MTDTTVESSIVDLSDADYFAHPAFSHSDCKLLLETSPAKYRWIKDNGERPYKAEFEFGHVVHELCLGVGAGIVPIEAADWRTKAAKEQRDEALAAGRYPILVADLAEATACADAVRAHPLAAKLLDHLDHAEKVAVWDDNGIERKAKIDAVCGRFGIDLKTTGDASNDEFGKSAGKYAYYSQDAWYRDALRACFGIDDPKFLFIVVEKNPPFLVNVIELDPYAVELGAKRNQRGIDLYRQCVNTGFWPAYGDGINQVTLPRWAEIQEENA